MAKIAQLEVTYLNARLYVRPEDQEEFIRLSPLYAKVIHENYGYQLVHASYATTGEVNVFTHIWKIPKGVALGDVMQATAEQVKKERSREGTLEAVLLTIQRVKEELGTAAPRPLIDERLLSSLVDDVEIDGVATASPVVNSVIHDLTRRIGEVLAALSKSKADLALTETCLQLHAHCDRCLQRGELLAGNCDSQQEGDVEPKSGRGVLSTENAADLLAKISGQLAKASVDALTALRGESLSELASSDSALSERFRNSSRPHHELAAAFVELAEMAVKSARQNYLIPGVASPFLKIQSLIQRTEQHLLAALPYDPNLFGHQSQTIIVDAAGDLWLMEHDKLRAMTDREVVPESQTDKELRVLLGQGATIATLKGEGQSEALLFNLAGIQPKSVFQHRAAPPKKGDEPFKMLAGFNGSEFPVNVDKIYVAAPWGTIYDLDSRAIESASVSLRVGDDTKTFNESEDRDEKSKLGTKHLMGALLESRVPLAAIPEVRDQDIGWGFYCYVINLQSFVRQPLAEMSAASAE
jgi:hypothetical protein